LYSEKGRSQLFFFFFLFWLGYLSQFSTLENFKEKSLKSFEVEKALKYQIFMGIMLLRNELKKSV